MNDVKISDQEICSLTSSFQKGVIKSYIANVKEKNTPVAVICFSINLSTQVYKELEEIIMLFAKTTNYSPLYECKDGLFYTFIQNMQLHHGVQILKDFNQKIEKLYKITLSYGALTIIDKDDNYKSLIRRMSKYTSRAAVVGKGKICYGTSQYDFFTKKDEKDILKNFFISSSHTKLYNFYNGIPLSEDAGVMSYVKGILRLKVSFGKATFLKHESFTFLRHELLPDTLKADIVNTFPKQGTVVLTNLRFIEKSPIDRETIRVIPNVPIDVSIIHENGKEIQGTIKSISVNTVAIKIDNQEIVDSYFQASDARFTLIFKLQTTKGKAINLKIFALYLTKNDNQIIFSICMDKYFKQKIENYIELQQTKLKTIVQKMVLDYYQK